MFAAQTFAARLCFAQQRSVSITIDDVPNVRLFTADGNSSKLLSRLDSMKLPVAIFINEQHLSASGDFEKNKNLLKTWLAKDFVTAGNHSFSHPNYGEIGFEAFSEDVVKGEKVTQEILAGSGKKLEYFRFPFNATGRDSLEQSKMRSFLMEKHYISTPFTVENEDWLYTQLYEKALSEGNKKLAASIGNQFIQMTLKRFDFFDSLSVAHYGKPIKQIYLCHDNRLNTDYLPLLVKKLKEKKYNFISLADAMSDPVYQSQDYYHGNAGFSWIYRWMGDLEKRRAAMRIEPENQDIQKAYEEMQRKK
ncbi:polysaccharide deacetylase [Dyadobacter luticola]|uniref:Polysaccharide deacetylase n=2 Tax=Dyadobacter luticola TaxID=1979387 RepID=A0A5R9KZN9_9BACT|nr:polysaccharide deacetylase [Dyadobacter luticola]